MSFHNHHAILETKSEDGSETDVAKAVADMTAAFDTKMTALQGEVKSANDAARAAKERADALEVKLNRPGAGRAEDSPTLEQKAFVGYVRGGREILSPDEAKALRVADNTAGGYLAPDQITTEILKDLVEFSPLRAAARVGQMSASAITIPKRTGRIGAQWVSEIEERPKTEPTYGQLEIPANEMACFVDVSNQLLEDAAVDIEAELRTDFAEEFGRLEGEAFVAGDGVKKPVGILSDASVPTVLNGHATELQPDALIKLMYALPSTYRNRGAWLLNGSSIALIRLIKDDGGRYIWQESLADGEPPTLLGRPVIDAVDMPDILANATPIAFGDFASAYRIYDRVGLGVLRDPFSMARFGQTRFHARRRVGAGVVRPEAIRKLKMATS